MQVGKGTALVIWAAYENGIINFDTFCEIRKRYHIMLGRNEDAKKTCSFLWKSQYPK